MAPKRPLAMGELTGVGRYTFHIRPDGNHCVLRELERRNNNDDAAQEQVIVAGSLQALNCGADRPMAAIPVSANHHFTALNVYATIQPVALAFARDFAFKKDVAAEAPFRLIHPTLAPQGLRQDGRPPSFIALSYCWHNPQWAPDAHPVDTLPAGAVNFSWPISKWMVQSLLLERTSPSEGIWIDQCCINQDDPLEKARTIGFMNLIHEQARLVVVVLEDVMIDAADGALLESLMQKCSSQGSTESSVLLESASVHHVVRLALKIFSARWFTRAWCNHELLVSRNHVFLMGVSTPPEDSPRILRMTLLFISSLILVCSNYDYTGAKDLYHSELMEQYQKLRQRGFLHIILNPFGLGAGYNLIDENSADSTVHYMKSPVETLRNLSKFGATVAADKVAIALNIVGCGLYYSGPDRSEHDCGLLLSVVALAAGDPTVLCCTGAGYNLPGNQNTTSWIQQPQQLDFAGVAGRKGTHRRLDYVPAFTLNQVELDFIYLVSNTDAILRTASQPYIKQAQWFVDGCIETSKTDAMFRLGASFIQARRTKILVVACALECGSRWINEAARAKTSADYPDPDLEGAIRVFFARYEEGYSFPALVEQHRDCYEQLTDVLETLTLDYVSPIDDTLNWSPAWLPIGATYLDKILFMCPPSQAQPFYAAIPTLLLHKDYTDCKRLFLLSTVNAAASDTWKVLGKSLVFGGDLDVLLTLESSRVWKGQKIRS